MAKKKKAKVHVGERGGRFIMVRAKGGGTKRQYLKKGQRAPYCK